MFLNVGHSTDQLLFGKSFMMKGELFIEILKETMVNHLSEEHVKEAIFALPNEAKYEIPMYSAKKIDGKKLYELAREQNITIDASERMKSMKFWEIKVLSMDLPKVRVSFWCSKGSFVRSWIKRLGDDLKCGAIMTELSRTGIDHYQLAQAQKLDQIKNSLLISEDKKSESSFFSYIRQRDLIPESKKFELNDEDAAKMTNGLISYHLEHYFSTSSAESLIFCTYQQELIGVLENHQGLRIKRVFRNNT
jgi:tRNA pseudouridine55 synthase